MRIPLALKAGDYNSVKSRGQLVNLIAETNAANDYLTVRRTEGLSPAYSSPNGEPIRSNIHKNGDYYYYIAGTVLYRYTVSTSPVSLGVVGGSGWGQVLSNSIPGDNQILALNGSGEGYIYDSSGLNQITDPDFYATTSATILNERFWFARDGTNEFFASDVSNGASYNPLSFGTAEWKPDNVVVTISKKSALWVIGAETMEYWQSVDDPLFPVRAVRGASQDIGILAKNSFAELDDYFAFLTDDSNIVLVNGTDLKVISDLEFQNKIRGDGTPQNPGFTDAQIQACEGFFVDTPQHKMYFLSFPTASYTWAYDINTGLTFTRASFGGQLAWRGSQSLTSGNQVWVGDRIDGSIWQLDPATKDEGDASLVAIMVTPSISFAKDAYIPVVNVEMEVGVAESVSADPLMIVYFSKDGGKTFTVHSHIPLGGWGQYNKRIPLRRFGKLVRYKDFVLKFVVSDAVRVQFYSIDAEIDFDA